MSLSSTSRRPRAENRPSIGFARHRRFTSEEQPTIAAFAQVLGHRVRGLLTSIEGFTDLLIPSLDDPDQRELAFRILESTSRIEGILHDLQHYNDPIEAHFHRTPVGSIAADVTVLLADSELNRVEVIDHPECGANVRSDETLLRQAIMALIRNALDATGGDAKKIVLDINVDSSERLVAIRVTNPGGLSDPAVRSKVFDPFFTTKASNLGLGLTLARRIARVHGGDLLLASSADSDMTEFTMTLPTLEDAAGSA